MQKILADYVAKYRPLIDEGIARELGRRKKEVAEMAPQIKQIVEMMEELALGGKRLRAILTILGYELAGKKVDEEVIKAAVAMEIFHLGLLIHDDIMDNDDLRRGVTTIHARFFDRQLGQSLAICAGDYCFAWTSDLLCSLKFLPKIVLAGLDVWNLYFARVGYGQTLDVWTESRGDLSEEEIVKVLALKSGEYSCVLPLLLGATLGEGSVDLKNKLKKYGMELGWVFQLRDDYLAEYGQSQKTGKPVGNDSREGKRTLVTIYGRERAEKVLASHMQKAMALAQNELMMALVEYVGKREN